MAKEAVPPGPPEQHPWQHALVPPQQGFQQQQQPPPWSTPAQPWQQHQSTPAQDNAPWQTSYSPAPAQDAAPPPPPPPETSQPEAAPQISTADPAQPPAEQQAGGEMTQEQYQAMSAEQQAAYWEQWNAYYAHYYQQPDQQYAGYQQYQPYAAQPGQYPAASEAPPPAQEAPAYYQQGAPQGYQPPPSAPQVHTMTHTYASAPLAPQPAYMGLPGAPDYAALGPGAGVPQRKKPPVPEWLRQTLLQRGITPGALPDPPAGQPGSEDEHAAPRAQPRRFTEGSSGSRWAEGEEAGIGTVMGRARVDSGSDSDSEGDAAAEQERRMRLNMELKRHMTSILLEVTDPLFSTLASEALRESLTSAKQSAAAATAGKADAAGEAEGESDISSGGPDLLGLGYGSDDNAPAKDMQQAHTVSEPEAEQKPDTAPVMSARPKEAPPEARMYSKGDRVWYIARDGARMAAMVVSVDISHPPPFFGVCLDGSQGIRETEGHRLAAMTSAEVAEQQQGQPQDQKTEQSPVDPAGAGAAGEPEVQQSAATAAPMPTSPAQIKAADPAAEAVHSIKAEPAAAEAKASKPHSTAVQLMEQEPDKLVTPVPKVEDPPAAKAEPQPVASMNAQPEPAKVPVSVAQPAAEQSVKEEPDGHAPHGSTAAGHDAATMAAQGSALHVNGQHGTEHAQLSASAAKRKHPEGSSDTIREHKRSKGKSKDKDKAKDKDKGKDKPKAKDKDKGKSAIKQDQEPELPPALHAAEQQPDSAQAADDPAQQPGQGKSRHKIKAERLDQTKAAAAAKDKGRAGREHESGPSDSKPEKASRAQDGSHAQDGKARKGKSTRAEQPGSKERNLSCSPSPRRSHRKRSRSRSRQRRSASVRRPRRDSTPQRRQRSPTPPRRRHSPARHRRRSTTPPRRRRPSPPPPRRRRRSPSPSPRRRSSTPPRHRRRPRSPSLRRRSRSRSPRRTRRSPSPPPRRRRSASLPSDTRRSGDNSPSLHQVTERDKTSSKHSKKHKR